MHMQTCVLWLHWQPDGGQRVNELKELAITGNKALEQAAKEYHTATDEPFIKFAVPFIRTAMENHKKG